MVMEESPRVLNQTAIARPQVPGAPERGKKAIARIESGVASMDGLTKIQYRVTLEKMEGKLMIGPIRIWATAFIAALAINQVRAANLAPTLNPEPLPPPPLAFYVRAGALGGFPETNARPTGGGFFRTIPTPSVSQHYRT
jgi:hypothetical protein